MPDAPPRIEDFMPLPDWVREQLTGADRYLMSFPRCGRTWLMHMLSIARWWDEDPSHAAAAADAGLTREELYTATQHRLCPVLHQVTPGWTNPFAADAGGSRPAIALLSHDWFDVRGAGPHLYLYRNPADSLRSYYNYALRGGHLDPGEVSRDEFVNGNVTWWILHMQRAIDVVEAAIINGVSNGASQPSWMLLSYEELYSDPRAALRGVLRHFGFQASERALDFALEKTKPADIRTNANDSPTLESRPGGGQAELSETLLTMIRTHATPLYDRLRGLSAG
ncbi:MAG: sulfotransferase domain-containing protein [Planctomycetota bacterium]